MFTELEQIRTESSNDVSLRSLKEELEKEKLLKSVAVNKLAEIMNRRVPDRYSVLPVNMLSCSIVHTQRILFLNQSFNLISGLPKRRQKGAAERPQEEGKGMSKTSTGAHCGNTLSWS